MTHLDDLTLGREDALFLDFDGTLVDFGPDPGDIWMPPDLPPALHVLAERLGGALCVISGRDLRDLARRVPGALWRAGGHGLEIAPPHAPVPEAQEDVPPPVLESLAEIAAREGVRLERKGPVVALHYRLAPEAEGACLAAAEAAAAAVDGYKVMPGKCVVEVKPARADKGRALREMIEMPPFRTRRPVMIGDDTTDEAAIRAARDLGGVGVKVGDGDSAARLRAAGPEAVQAWLCRQAG